MPSIDFNDQEWQIVIQALMKAPWELANPILLKMSQLGTKQQTNSGEMPVNKGELAGRAN